jgi:2-amino-4-hydroxy-6-hydroxymethyldihydropteridine diphosphokinase
MNQAYLLIGGNLGDREANLASAAARITTRCGPLLKASSLYVTGAWGRTDQPDFLNQAILLSTALEAQPLLDELLSIEREMGRRRKEKYGPRTIDIDILFFNHDVIRTASLTIPHPHLEDRRFVLEPLAEIAGAFRHPVSGRTMNDLLAECTDALPVHKFAGIVQKKD